MGNLLILGCFKNNYNEFSLRKVVFIRHAKSSWDHPELADYQRPVAERGFKAIALVGEFLKERALFPDLVLTSGANRAYTTAKGLTAFFTNQPKIIKNDKLYFCGKQAVYNLIKTCPNHVETLFLVFHNPDINDIVIGDFVANETNIPTLGCVITQAEINDWKHWDIKKTSVTQIVKPKKLY